MKKIICLLAGLLLTAAVATSCGEIQPLPTETEAGTSGESVPGSEETTPGVGDSDHTHTFDEHWTNDETHHWHASSCEHGDVVADKAAHVDEDGNDVCDVCGFRNKHEHTYEDTWTIGENTHYYKNTCGHDDVEKYRKDEAKHADKNNDGLCDVCSYDYGHEHTYDTENWVKTENGHWHAPTCGHDIPGIDLADHADADNNGICDGCAYDYDHTHTWSESYSKDDDYHWRDVTCGHSIDVVDKNAHVSDDGDKICDVCDYEPPHIHSFDSSKWISDKNGHWHASTCGHDVRADEVGHNGYEEDGVCDTCEFVVFRFYTVTVTLPEESVMIKAPDGTDALSFDAKEGTDVVFKLTLPRYIEIINMKGAAITGSPVMEGSNHTYTVTVKAIGADTDVTMELKKNSNVQVIVDYQEATLEVTQKFKNEGQLTFTIPAAGRYIIYANNMDIDFNLAGNTAEQDDTSTAYIFDAQAGEVTMDYSYFAWSIPADQKLVFNYVVARVEKNTTLDTLEGNGCIMPTNYAVNISFKLPSAGFYQIISTSQVSWDFDITQPHFFYVPEGGELERTIAIKYDSETESQFIFDWKIEHVAPVGALEIGENALVARKGAYTAVTFTAPRDGNYHFATGDPNAVFFRWVETEWGDYLQRLGANSVIEELAEGDTITLFLSTDPYADEGTITGDINCNAYIAYAPGSSGEAVVGMDNAFVSDEYEDTDYTLTAMNGDLISIDGGVTWHAEISTTVPGYGALYYQVQSASGADTVVVYAGETTYEIFLTLGENPPATMIPGQAYVLHLTGAEESQGYYMNYILSWTDPNLVVTYGNATVTSGGQINLFTSTTTSLVAVYNGETDGSVVFTLAEGTPAGEDPGTPDDPDDPDIPDISSDVQLEVGRNTVEVTNGYTGVSVTFTATSAGTYTIAYAPNVTNGVAFIETDFGSEELSMPYTVTLAEGESVKFILGTVNYEADSIGMSVTRS